MLIASRVDEIPEVFQAAVTRDINVLKKLIPKTIQTRFLAGIFLLFIARAEQVNPSLNGLIIPLYEQARERAAAPLDGPLAGVPMLVKDLFQEMGGAPCYQGNKARKKKDIRADQDSTLVARWKAAGLVPFGRTNTPEFGAKGITEPDSYGPARNPWNPDHTPGGSSGGSAAMVAAGVVVDTHVMRLAQRMGLTEQKDRDKIERDLMTLVPKKRWTRFARGRRHRCNLVQRVDEWERRNTRVRAPRQASAWSRIRLFCGPW